MGYKGIKFNNKHTFTDWGLVQTAPLIVTSPEPKTNYVEVPAMDGHLDATESLDGFVHYNIREIQAELTGTYRNRSALLSAYSEILNYIHGQKVTVIDDDDSEYYWTGRAVVENPDIDGDTMTVKIKVTVSPFKISVNSYTDNWLWDTFNFETDVIREYDNITVGANTKIVYYGSGKPYTPYFTCSSAMEVKYNGTTYSLPSGKSRIVGLIVSDGPNELIFNGSGTVKISYEGGSL